MRTALVTGVSGQDGSYMAEMLLREGYRVIGATRSAAAPAPRIRHLLPDVELVELDSLSSDAICRLVAAVAPDEIYNLAAMASSSQLFGGPEALMECNGVAAIRWLEAIAKTNREIRYCQASSSEMFGNSSESPQSETTCFRPRNPYGVAKLCAHLSVAMFRDHLDVFACSGILFNHESPRRGPEFVTRKITRAVAAIHKNQQHSVALGNLDAKRDWGYAADYVRGMWQMLQAKTAGDYVFATGEMHSVREFCEVAFAHVNLDYREFVVTDPASYRPAEAVLLVGDASKARRELDWKPSIAFEDLVCLMVDEDVKALEFEDPMK